MAKRAEQLPTWCGGDDWCPMVATSAVLGRKWHPVIVQRLLAGGPLRFGELEDSIQGVSGKVLSESLSDLQEKGLVERTVVDEQPVQVEYALTEHGAGLADAVEELERWGREYLREAAAPGESII
jgi:DNA-binding HxlR family transcriptional regulator